MDSIWHGLAGGEATRSHRTKLRRRWGERARGTARRVSGERRDWPRGRRAGAWVLAL